MIWVTGSIARDFIMDYPGRFADHIDPQKIHVLNLSFGIDYLQENIGGTAANISYNLSLLGERCELVGNIGFDSEQLLKHFRRLGIGVRHVSVSKKIRTAAAYIISDRDDNQINGFYRGAMAEKTKLPRLQKKDWGIVAAGDKQNMVRLSEYFAAKKVKYIFDPGQGIFSLTRAELETCMKNASVVMGNDYEIGLIRKKTKIPVPVLIQTLGPKGSEIYVSRRKIKVKAVKPKRVVDPTGAGDAYRAGLLKGLILGYDIKTCGQIGASVASFAVEEYGTQNHRFSRKDIGKRYMTNFQEQINEI